MNMIKPVLHHVALKTTRLQEMIRWYSVVLGTDVVHDGPVNAWITNDAANHRIALFSLPGQIDDPHKSTHNGIHHTAFEYESFADLMSSFKRMSDESIVPAFSLDHGMTTSLYYRDPDGNFVELQSDNFGDWQLSTEYMRNSTIFAENPVGHFFDPAKLYRAFQADADLEVLHGRIRADEFKPDALPDLGLPEPEDVSLT